MGRVRKQVDAPREILFDSALEDLRTGKIKSIRGAAERYGLQYETLRDRKRGTANRVLSHEDQQHLTNAEEKAIVAWIGRVDDYGWPPKIEYVKQIAAGFMRSHGKGKTRLGKNWITRFLDRHPSLAAKFATRLDKQRSYASNPLVLRDFFTKVYQAIKYSIPLYMNFKINT